MRDKLFEEFKSNRYSTAPHIFGEHQNSTNSCPGNEPKRDHGLAAALEYKYLFLMIHSDIKQYLLAIFD